MIINFSRIDVFLEEYNDHGTMINYHNKSFFRLSDFIRALNRLRFSDKFYRIDQIKFVRKLV